MNAADNGCEQPATKMSDTQNSMDEKTCDAVQQPETELEAQKKEYADLNDRFFRMAADFENFRKRSERERESYISLANERFAIDLLEVLDNLDRALKGDDAHLREGIMHIHQLLTSHMQRHGVHPIDSRKKPFNPAEHEAIAHVPSEEAAGTIVDEVSCGYRMHDKVIRYAKVAVSKGNQNNQEV
jgi:molecular chaperone GrpE